eukprot:CAMPEP_0184671812 /NCGR_PEP_ID=MMETSP0308-20130426/85724_1 /TAXON_ID=38269 /ORGANISM="Gloeochaete witrockiana, Strain SAG 46.84" /LENGTH=152 /DNA_ID=CAMNT_0027119011 /DNA_START=287 /DNA_END=746 /DNA_ORIENTATION=-
MKRAMYADTPVLATASRNEMLYLFPRGLSSTWEEKRNVRVGRVCVVEGNVFPSNCKWEFKACTIGWYKFSESEQAFSGQGGKAGEDSPSVCCGVKDWGLQDIGEDGFCDGEPEWCRAWTFSLFDGTGFETEDEALESWGCAPELGVTVLHKG